ncbi:hypothetical protein K3495_g5293 [Podosphaera aphanis]|nr:hypothetical protein K3495_g5293 [Podosphaera aphanis]
MQGLRVAFEGCGHGTLHAIYTSVKNSCKLKGWDGVDLLIIGGDFQAVRNASDLTVMSCPVKYRQIGDFQSYYRGNRKAPYLTLFIGGNHEASSHLWELFYGGWVAPNIYYMGAANVLRLGGVRIMGMSGIWKGYDFKKPHFERLPYNKDDIKSIYHVREIDIRKLLQIRTQVDIGISHDWPKAIEKHGNSKALFKKKPDFRQESRDGTLGNPAAKSVMDRLRPHYWFSAHLHCKFAAIKEYGQDPNSKICPNPDKICNSDAIELDVDTKICNSDEIELDVDTKICNSDEIELDVDTKICNSDEIELDVDTKICNSDEIELDVDTKFCNADEIELDIENTDDESDQTGLKALDVGQKSSLEADDRMVIPDGSSAVCSPPSIDSSKPTTAKNSSDEQTNMLISPPITNKTVNFLALDKCLPGRKFLQLLSIPWQNSESPKSSWHESKPIFEYDPEWLAINRVFAPAIILGDRNSQTPPDQGEDYYRPLIEKEREWIEENVVKEGKLRIPNNFSITAPPFRVEASEIVTEGPREYNNPQMQQYCDLIGIPNKFFATKEEKIERFSNGPPPAFGGPRSDHGSSSRNSDRRRGKARGQKFGKRS